MNPFRPVLSDSREARPSRFAGRRGWRWVSWLGLNLGAMLVGISLMRAVAAEEKSSAPPQFLEEEVKAAILVGFARTTTWPAGTFKDENRTFRIGIVGKDTLGEKATSPFRAGVGGKPPVARFKVVLDEAGARECHVLFIPRSERRRGRELMDRLKRAPILTIGESEDFLDQDGMVKLVPRDGAMKFEVNLNPTKEAGLRIPARVLGSALSVRGKYD